jgi:REP element-mobilizing transposase RayT
VVSEVPVGLFAGLVEIRLNQIIDEIVGEVGSKAIEVVVIPRQMHLLIEIPSAAARSKLGQQLKGRSSRRLLAEVPQLSCLPVLWLCSYVFMAGGAPPEVVRSYVENQKAVA